MRGKTGEKYDRIKNMGGKRTQTDHDIRWAATGVFLLVVLLGAWNTDDGYFGFVMARNLAEGHGFVYNIGERVNVSTCPLFDLILSVFYYWFRNMPLVSIVLCTLYSLAAYSILIWKICKQRWQVFVVTVLLCTSTCFISFTTSGLENSLLFFEEALFLHLLVTNDTYDRKKLFQMALVCSAVLMTRMDAGILLFAVTAYCFLVKRSCGICSMFLAGLAGLCPFFGWIVFSVIYYGVPFPNTYYIKVNTGYPLDEYILHGLEYFLISWGYDTALITFCLLAVVLLFLHGQWKYRMLALGICLKLLYVIRIGGDFMVGRHFTDLYFVSVFMVIDLCYEKESFHIGKRIVSRQYACIGCAAVCVMLTSVTRLTVKQYLWPVRQDSCTDERDYYFPTLGMIPHYLTKVVKGIDSSELTWDAQEVLDSKASGNQGDLLTWAPGLLSFQHNRDFYMSDSIGLGDPLLAKLPAVYTEVWRVGHMKRLIPEGYPQSLQTGENRIADKSLHQYYDILLEVTRGRIFSKDRLYKTAGMLFGKYDYLLDEYQNHLEQKTEEVINGG